jgi:hypothetical protein
MGELYLHYPISLHDRNKFALLNREVRCCRSFFLFLVSWGGWDWFHLVCPSLFGLLYHPRMTDKYGAFGVMRIGRGNWSTRRKLTPVSLCPSSLFKYGSQNRYTCPLRRPISVSSRFLFKQFYSQHFGMICSVQINSRIYILTVHVWPHELQNFKSNVGHNWMQLVYAEAETINWDLSGKRLYKVYGKKNCPISGLSSSFTLGFKHDFSL